MLTIVNSIPNQTLACHEEEDPLIHNLPSIKELTIIPDPSKPHKIGSFKGNVKTKKPIDATAYFLGYVIGSNGKVLTFAGNNICTDGVTKCPTKEYKLNQEIDISNLPKNSKNSTIVAMIFNSKKTLAAGVSSNCTFSKSISKELNTIFKGLLTVTN
ncbi:22965_t:CDS:1 [Dentiscutata erythropus]|uniref:22965_t:CDS:1 n=1 Tax=Dentiscutata erythropus TaxID=1348616 RepID=A0A9N9NAD3_9GLOM|nr:22965_t:CDS:1 [Dentiscutata erythropus]